MIEPTMGAPAAGTPRRRPFMAAYGYAGAALVALAWAVSWTHVAVVGEWGFFPLWLGYIVVVDALVYPRCGRSLLHSTPLAVVRLFLTSAVVWWIFEAFNVRTQNWHYLQPHPVGPLRFVLEASLDFSTVLPAVFETAALWGLLIGHRHATAIALRRGISRRRAAWFFAAGVVCLALPLWLPLYFYGLIWGCLWLLVDPANAVLRRPSLLAAAAALRSRALLVLALSGLTCGFFWEMWNSLSMPKWTYVVPWIPQARLFEMPWVGYVGYIPFAFECFALYQFSLWLLRLPPEEVLAPDIP